MKPVILITLHRRYHELHKSLKNIHSKKVFFKQRPSIVLIWADPEPSRKWFIDNLLKEKIIDHVIYRYKLLSDSGGHGTTFSESQNIRLGLENVFRLYDDCYCIVQASDICITEYGFYLIEQEMNNKANVINFTWANRFSTKAWHTNCFAVSKNKEYWPPCCDINCTDTLERLWYNECNLYKGITTLSNNNEVAFIHKHISEKMDAFPIKPVNIKNSFNLFIKGSMTLLKRLRCIFLGDINVKNSN